MIWVLLTAGRGPEECQLAVTGLAAQLCEEARGAGLDAELLEAEPGRHGALSALLALRGEGAAAFARSWEGTIRWTCPSPIRRGWPRKNWFVSGSLLLPPEEAQAPRQADLRFDTMRASGPGGQHVNKTESAVRLTHLPTGLQVVAREERSQHRNRSLAVARLAALLAEQAEGRQQAAARDRWQKHDALERGNPVRIYEGPAFHRAA